MSQDAVKLLPAIDSAADKNRRSTLDQPPVLPREARLALIAAAVRRNGASVIRIAVSAAFGPGKLNLDEICYYRLLDGDVSPEGARRFVGKNRQAVLHPACNNAHWFAAAHDKALFYTIMSGIGHATPETIAISGPRSRAGFPRHLAEPEDVAEFLSKWTEWPLFAKPIDGMYSIGALRISDASDAELTVDGIGTLPVEEVARYIAGMSAEGYLFQRCLLPAESTSASSQALPSVRLLILLAERDAVVESAVLKIPARDAIADNYWRTGNLLAALDTRTGEILRVVSGSGADMQFYEKHPEDGRQLVGTIVPGWQEICNSALAGASSFPGIRTQSWDIALTREGPVPLEFNFGGDLNLHQIAHRRGALTNRYIEHLKRCGYRRPLV